MENYINYYTEIEEHFQRRRGMPSLLSPLDWALIESFQEAGILLETVLHGIDLAFEKHQRQKSAYRKVNSLSYCTQAILTEHQRLQESSVGKSRLGDVPALADKAERDNLLKMILHARDLLGKAAAESRAASRVGLAGVFESAVGSLISIEEEFLYSPVTDFEDLEMRLNVLEERILSSLIGNMEEEELLGFRREVNSELKRHRRGLKAEQLAMLEKKLMNRKILEKFKVPRLSLFYLPLN
jgi:hypothetical protein